MVVLNQAEACTPVPDSCHEHGATFYKWRAKFGGMDVSLVAKLKELEDENRRLEKMYVDAQTRTLIVKEALAKKVIQPSQRRELAKVAVAQHGIATSPARTAFGISETCYRYQAKRSAENEEVANWMIRLTDNNCNWGFGLCCLYLRNVRYEWLAQYLFDMVGKVQDFAAQWVWNYNHERQNMALDGFTRSSGPPWLHSFYFCRSLKAGELPGRCHR